MSKRPPLATELELMLREQHRIGYAAGFGAGIEAAAKAVETTIVYSPAQARIYLSLAEAIRKATKESNDGMNPPPAGKRAQQENTMSNGHKHQQSDPYDQAKKAWDIAVAKWRTDILPAIKAEWAKWSVGERVAFATGQSSDLFGHGIAQDDPDTINCYEAGQLSACANIGVTYVEPTDADRAKVIAFMATLPAKPLRPTR